MNKIRLSSEWKKALMADLDSLQAGRVGKVTRTVAVRLAAQFFIMLLADKGIPYQIKNMGAGVTLITTETDKCPCCKRKYE